jgi:hypothetical protein
MGGHGVSLFIAATFVEQANGGARGRMPADGEFWSLSRGQVVLDLSNLAAALFVAERVLIRTLLARELS